MAETTALRLSPSGLFIGDASSGAPLPIGPGSIGLVFRAQGDQGATPTVDAGLTAIPGLDDVAVDMPPGYHYDVQAELMVQGGNTSALMTCQIETSTDGGSTWGASVCRNDDWRHAQDGGSIRGGEIDVDRTAASDTINRVRVRAHGISGMQVIADCSFLRIEQYVL